LNPLRFLADWHQGPTHSVVLLPLWAVLVGGLFTLAIRRPDRFAETVWISALGLATHILADVITVYGTALLYPTSGARYSLGTTFVIDPLFTAVVALGLGLTLGTGRRLFARLGAAVLCAYVGGQALLQHRAIEVGCASVQRQAPAVEGLVALPQPFSPFNWKLIGIEGIYYHVAHLNLAGHPPLVPSLPGMPHLAGAAGAYQPPARLTWDRRHRFGNPGATRALVERLWHHPQLDAFRRFAVFPSLSRIDRNGDATCIWFTDLRYDLPGLPDTFRYGFCRDGVASLWRLHRLRYFTDGDREPLPQGAAG
jgi:inner membrane protein